MAGNKAGGIKASITNKERHGADFYVKTGALGGLAKVPKGFALNRELARLAGKKSGKVSKRRKHELAGI